MKKINHIELTENILSNISSFSVNEKNAQDMILKLHSVIHYHNYRYHSLADPIISDIEYDQLFHFLLNLEDQFPDLITEWSPTQLVAPQVVDWFTKARHTKPMLSLQNSYDAQDIKDRWVFLQRQSEEEVTWFVVEAKLDGSSIELIYRFGKLSQAITRWDWTVWEDITKHAFHFSNLPHVIKEWEDIETVSLRWEVVMPQTAFEKVNKRQIEQWLPIFANSRNAAAWTLRQLNPRLVWLRGLVVYCFEVLEDSWWFNYLKSDTWILNYLLTVWIPVFDWYQECTTIEEVVALCSDDEVRDTTQLWNVACDWLVIKVNNFSLRNRLWFTDHHPRWAIAYKYPTQEIAAHIADITYQIWRTWVITPLANITPVELWWVTISKATLHNFDFIVDRDIRVWDRVWLKRSWEVIPYVIWPILERRWDQIKKIVLPKQCPSCEHQLINSEWEVAWYCPNNECKDKKVAQLQHFVSKQCMNISWLWDAFIEVLLNVWLVVSIPDIYLLKESNKRQQLLALPWIWHKKTDQILNEIEVSLSQPLWRKIHWLWILWVWKKIAKSIADYLQSNSVWDAITLVQLQSLLKKELLNEVFWIWEVIAVAVEERVECNLLLLETLIWFWFFVFQEKSQWKNIWAFVWEKIVLTWTLPIKRDVLASFLEEQWAQIMSAVSTSTTKLIAWENAWSKLKKAQWLWIEIVSYDDLLGAYKNISFPVSIDEENSPIIQQGLF